MDIKFANNASSKLVDNIEEDTVTFSILPDTGVLFPILEQPTDFFKITVVDPGTGDFEIMKVTDIQGDRLTVDRGQEGTLAKAFPQNAIVENRLTAQSIDVILNDVDASSTTAGRIRVATEEEVMNGTATDCALTPANSGFLKVLRGTIVAFSGQVDDDGFVIDGATGKSREDWHICNGKYGTPDLRDRFIIGAGNDYFIGSSGGSTSYTFKVEVGSHALTIDEMPEHFHRCGQDVDPPWKFGDAFVYKNNSGSWQTHSNWKSSTDKQGKGKPHTHTTSVTTPDKILPPYYALIYIMKIK